MIERREVPGHPGKAGCSYVFAGFASHGLPDEDGAKDNKGVKFEEPTTNPSQILLHGGVANAGDDERRRESVRALTR